MRLSRLIELAHADGLTDPIVAIEGEYRPLDIREVDPGIAVVDGMPVEYLLLFPQHED